MAAARFGQAPTRTHRGRAPRPPGITVNQLQSCGGAAEALPAASLLPAALCVLGSVTVPSAASVYNEFALKKHMDTSVHLQARAGAGACHCIASRLLLGLLSPAGARSQLT